MTVAAQILAGPAGRLARRLEWAAAVAAVSALAARDLAPGGPAVVVAAGVVGLAAHVPSREWCGGRRWLLVTGAGTAAFGAGRLLAGAPLGRAGAMAVVVAVVAAVAEEALFRRLLYARLEGHGAAAAVVVPAIAFAAVHVHQYGWRVVPLDLAAGLLLGWQRWATGGWSAPAATHAAANLLALA